jgi:hypothetical protein
MHLDWAFRNRNHASLIAVLWMPAALAAQSFAPGFSSIFDGKTLKGWEKPSRALSIA